MRFPLEVFQAIRDAYNNKIAIDTRISCNAKTMRWGEREIEEMQAFAKVAENTLTPSMFLRVGAPTLRAVNTCASPTICPTRRMRSSQNWSKKVVDIPVTVSGSIVTVAEAEDLIAEGKTDLVGMGRGTLVDDGQFIKAYRGQDAKIRPCIRCAYCTGRLEPPKFQPVRCAINPVRGRELQYEFIPRANKPKKLLIVGGGLAGMQAAQTAWNADTRSPCTKKAPNWAE